MLTSLRNTPDWPCFMCLEVCASVHLHIGGFSLGTACLTACITFMLSTVCLYDKWTRKSPKQGIEEEVERKNLNMQKHVVGI